MQDRTLSFIMKEFKKYYLAEKIEPPSRLSRREFGFMFFDKNFVVRHIGFSTRQELKEYIVANVPAHLYYSSAYYGNPNAQTMPDKRWMGADLVFDLDADHVRGAEGLSYPEMLIKVKKEVVRLLDEFILGDFGFDSEHVKIVFSGGRGYHVHVNDPRVLRLGSHERREIVDYITGTDLNFDWVFPPKGFDARSFAKRTHVIRKTVMPDAESGGWKGKMSRGLRHFITELEVMGEDKAASMFGGLKTGTPPRSIGEKTIREMYRELFVRKGNGMRGADRIIRENNLEVFSKQTYLTAFLRLVENHVKMALIGETDEPVTSDIRRLIRMPSSLHGKTGLRVTSLTRDSLDDFDPLRDAFPETLSEKPIRLNIKEGFEMRLKGENFRLKQGENDVPEFVALFLCCRKAADIA
ncbi:MAG: DNA primase small subunit PriS [Thermoplasmata archaeon]